MGGMDAFKWRLEATIICDFYLFGLGNLASISEKSENCEN